MSNTNPAILKMLQRYDLSSQDIELDVIHLNARLQQSFKLQNEDGVQLPKNIGKDFILTLLRDRV